MKKLIIGLLTSVVLFMSSTSAQNIPPASMADVDFSLVSWERGQVLVRFADQLSPSLNNAKSQTKITLVDQILADYQGVKLEQLFPVQKPIPSGEKGFTTYSGKYYEYPKLTNIYKVSIKDTSYGAIFPLITALGNLGDDYVVYAEPNYHFETDVSATPTDPLYQYQYNTDQMNADSVWSIMADSSITEEDIVIAILDTGVDTAHVDLKGKKHLNMLEVNGQPGIDDDGNGFIDDISGWDFVNLDNGPLDDNLHGTHCATIAVANHDTVGVAGVAPNAKYMSVKCLESSGWSNSATIAQAVTYAANNGADVISMSLGGYGRSLALENALGYSYAFSLPVGAAGNDAICIRNDGLPCPNGVVPRPMYPGAYTFVLGVQATMENPGLNGYRVGFSNYDFDGPAYTDYGDDFNYEVYAPGTNIMGGLPNDTWTYLSGTSMATPAVAGAVAIYKAFRPNNTNDRTFVDFIKSWYDPSGLFNKSGGYPYESMDLVKALYPDLGPMMWMDEFTVVDSLWGDGDGILDAGEVVQIRVDMKNVGHYTDSALVGIRMSQYEDKSIIHYEDSISFIGSISSYATVSNNTALFKFQVDSGVVNGRNINFNVYTFYPNGDTTSQDHWEQAQNGCEYNGIYSGKIEWNADCGIIVTGNTFIDTLIIKPGTHIQMDGQVGLAYNHIVCEGTQDSLITFTKNINDYQLWSGVTSFRDEAIFKYTVFEYGWPRTSNQLVGPGNKISFEDCVFRYNEHYYGNTNVGNHITLQGSQYVVRCVFEYNKAQSHIIGLEDDNWTGHFNDNIISGNLTENGIAPLACVSIRTINDLSRIKGNSFLRHRQQLWAVPNHDPSGFPIGIRWSNGGGHQLPTFQVNILDSNYFGTTSSMEIGDLMYDFTQNPVFPPVNASDNALSAPSSEAHGQVWKIELDTTVINILNNPVHKQIGLGTHLVKVYFNRPMDVSVTPFVTYGVRQPFTQNIIGDSTSWSSDSLTWTSYFTVDQTTSSDGYNKIAVRNAIDNEGFSIPIEDYRFEFRLDVAASLSNGFTAYGDTSQVNMFWNGPDSIADLIGYNVYRKDTTYGNGDTVLLNTFLIQDTTFFDLNVVGGQWYQYFYTSLRSNFSESQISKGVWATPYSSKPRVKTLKAQETYSGTIQFNAGVDANFIETEARFLYGTNPTNLNGATSWQSIGSNYYEVPFDRSISSVTAGTIYYYQAQAKNSLGLETGKVDSILTMSTPALTISGATQICSGDSISLAAQSVTPDTTMSLTWKYNGGIIGQGASLKHLPSGQGTYSIELHAEGTYTTPTVESYSVSITGVINNIAVTTTGSSQLCQGQTVSLSIPSGYSDILWNTGDTTSTISANQTGSYSATMKTSVAGCAAASASVNIVVNPLPVATVSTSSGAFDFCEGSSLTLEAPVGASGYQWYKDGTAISGAVSSTLSASGSGSYAVEVTSSDGCSALSASQTVVKNLNPTASISNASSLSFCDGGSVVLSAPSGVSYAWSDGSTTQSITQSSSGQLGLTITDVNGCSSVASPVTVNVYSVPSMTVSAASSSSICQGQSVTLQASGGFSSYAWSNGATNQNLIATTAGNYTVTGTTSDGCTVTSAAQTVTVNAPPVATITNNGVSVLCSGDSTILTAPSGMSSYLWSDGSTSESITTSTSGSYTVTVSNTDGCSATSAATGITSSTIIPPSITSSGSTTFCAGSTVTLSVPTGYANYMWSDGSTTNGITASSSGNYSVTLTNADGCSATTVATAVTVNTPPTASITSSGTGAICAGSSELLSATSGMISYQWYKDGTAVVGATSATYTANDAGNYSISVVDSNDCSALSTNYSITNAAAPVATITNNGVSVLCSGDSTTLTAPSGMSSYLWSDGSTSESITTSTSGSYTVTVSNTDGCSATSAATGITSSTIIPPSITSSGSTTFCAGSTVTLSVPTGYANYMWSDGSTTNGITASSSGNYSVTLTNADGCSATTVATAVTVNTPPTASITSSGTGAICAGSSELLSATSGMISYQWYKDGTAVVGATSATYTANDAGNYSISVVDSNDCSALSTNYSITNAAAPVATITNNGVSVLCSGDSTILTAPSGMSSYLWSDGSTSESITTSTSGSYTVTVSNTDGCSATSAATGITSSTIIPPSITSSGSTTFCAGSTVTLSVPTGYANYMWSDGSTTNGITASSSGNYSVTLTNADGCSATTVATAVTVNTPPTASITSSGTGAICAGSSELLSATSGMISYQWYKDGTAVVGATSATYTANDAGNYSISVVDSNDCSALSTNYSITNAAAPVATITNNGVSVLCSGDSTTLTAPSGMSSYLWSDGSTSESITTSTSGSYTVTVSNTDGCSATSAATGITSSTIIPPSITSSGSTTFCAGSTVTLSVPTGYANYMWSDGSTTNGITASSSGNYSVTLTNADGCSATTVATAVTVNTPPTASITSSGTGAICAGSSELLSATSGMISYQWYKDGTAVVGATSATYTANDAGNYSISVVDSNDCSALSTNYSITNAAAPVATITNNGVSVLCSGDSTTLTAPSGMSSYLWSDGSTSESITTSTSGSYTVTVSNTDGCSATSAATGITSSTIIPPSITSSGSTTFCAGSTVTLSVPTGYANYMWSDGSTTNGITASSSGNYSVTLTNADGCSATTVATAVTVNTPPTASITSTGTGAICAGSSETLSATSGMSNYQWYANGTAITGATSATYTANASGNYSVSIVDANGCSDISTNYAITNAAPPVATITNAGSNVLCSGDSTTLTAPSGMSSYLWSDGSTSQSLSVTSSGNYSVTVTNANGCSATSPTTVISTSQITAPTVTSNGALEFCDGGTVSLAVPAGYSSFMWNNGSGFSQIMATNSGDYYAQVMNADGCSAYSDTVTVTAFPTPPTPSISYTANDTLIISSEPTGNQWYFNGTIMQGETNDTLRPLNYGNYSVRVVDSNSCEGDMSAMQFYNSIGLEESLVDHIKLYPNPTSGAITLDLGEVNVASIRIYDARGRLLEELNECSGNCRIELGMFEDGLYQLVILTEEGKTVTKPVVLQKLD